MRTHRAAVWSVAASALLVGVGRAQAPEGLRHGAEAAWSQAGIAAPAIKFETKGAARPAQGPSAGLERKLFHEPVLFPIAPRAVGPALGTVNLAAQLDRHRTMIQRQLGALPWHISMASDPKFQVQYLTLFRAPALVLKRIDDLNRLRGDGVVVQADDQTQYRIKVSINIFSPVRGSTVNIDPVNGTRGPSHKLKTGAVLDAVKANTFVFKTGGKEFWLAYGTDVDPATDRLAATRSLLFVHEAGLDSKAWPVAESQLPLDQAVGIDLGGTQLSLVLASDGNLRLYGR